MTDLFTYAESFHTRNEMPAREIAAGEARALTQEAVILDWFRRNPEARVTPFEVQERTGIKVLTSVRRAMTGLAAKGFLVKDEENQRKGRYGVSNCLWRLA